MKLSHWARQQGLSYKTAWRMFCAGRLPVPAEQLATGTIVVHAPSPAPDGYAVLYARVSSHDQQADLERQAIRLTHFAAERGLVVGEVVKETGSALNGHRKALLRLLRDSRVQTIVVEHRERLMRFGFEGVEAALAAQGRAVLVADDSEIEDDIVRDLHDVIVSLCARLYGRRSARNRARRAIEAIDG